MRRSLFLTSIALFLTVGFLSSTPAAYAGTVSLTLASSLEGGPILSTVTFSATAFAPLTNAGDVYLVSDNYSVSGPLYLDDTDFFMNFPFFLSPGQSYTGDLFTVTIPAGTAYGYYTGYFNILGGPDGGTLDLLASVPFTVDATPEPSSLLLFGGGLAGIVAALKRKRNILPG